MQGAQNNDEEGDTCTDKTCAIGLGSPEFIIGEAPGRLLPSGCRENMEELLPSTVYLAVQSVAKGSSNACRAMRLLSHFLVCRGLRSRRSIDLTYACLPDEHPVMTTHRLPMFRCTGSGSKICALAARNIHLDHFYGPVPSDWQNERGESATRGAISSILGTTSRSHSIHPGITLMKP